MLVKCFICLVLLRNRLCGPMLCEAVSDKQDDTMRSCDAVSDGQCDPMCNCEAVSDKQGDT